MGKWQKRWPLRSYKIPIIRKLRRLFIYLPLALGIILSTTFLYAHRGTSTGNLSSDGQLSLLATGHKVCQLTGESDRQFQPPRLTLNQTASRFGLAGTDNGSSFMFNDRLWLLFGDSVPTANFRNRPNEGVAGGRSSDYNDSIAYTTDTTASNCLSLQFITGARGAFASPVVETRPSQKPVTLRTNEVPEAGIADGGKAYVVFSTDNTASNPVNGQSHPAGGGSRTVVASTADMRGGHFGYLYDLSTDKFTYVSLADGSDGYIYIWGVRAAGNNFRHSPPYLARKPIGGMGQATNIQYFSGLTSSGQPAFTSQEASAVPLFHDQPSDCIGELSSQWNPYLQRWLMLYNCANNSKRNPRGIYARTAIQPWGPWSAPLTVFDLQTSLCQFIHKANSRCDNLSDAKRKSTQGGAYSPYMLQSYTTGNLATAQTTIYYTLSTWNPYQVVLMSSGLSLNRH